MPVMYIDIHCHLDMLDADKAIENAKKSNVRIVCSGIDIESNRKCLGFAAKYDNVKCTIGLYPVDALAAEKGRTDNIDIGAEVEFIRRNAQNIVGIGEVGLDYKTGKRDSGQEEQFRMMIRLAMELDMPVVVHSRKAEEEAISILEECKCRKVVMHCFSGKKNLLLRAKKNGWYFTVPTNVVRSQQFQEMAAEINLTRLLCETDSPFLSPFPGIQNEPAFVVESYKKIAEIKGIELEEAEKAIYMNWQTLFE